MVWGAIHTIESGAYMGIENIILLLLGLGGLLFYALDVKIGLIIHFIFYGCAFMAFYEMGLQWVSALIIMFIFVALLALSLLMVSKQTEVAV